MLENKKLLLFIILIYLPLDQQSHFYYFLVFMEEWSREVTVPGVTRVTP